MSDPSQSKNIRVKSIRAKGEDNKKKLLLIGGGFIGLILVVNVVMLGGNNKVVQIEHPTETVTLTPSGVEEQSFESRTQTLIAGMRSQMQRAESDRDDLRQKINRLTDDLTKMHDDSAQSLIQLNKSISELNRSVDKLSTAKGSSKSDHRLPSPDRPSVGALPVVPPPDPFGKSAYPVPQGQGNTTTSVTDSKGVTHEVIAEEPQAESRPLILRPRTKSNSNKDKVTVSETRTANPYAGWLAPGSVEAAMLTGIQASTSQSAQGAAQPVMFRIQGNAQLAGSAQYQLKGCYIFGDAHGDARTKRAYIDITTLSCVDVNNHFVLEETLTGYVADSDSEIGLRGEYVEERASVLWKATLASIVEGLGDALGGAQGTSFSGTGGTGSILNTAEALRSSGFKGAATGAQTLSDFWLKEVEGLFPVIRVPARRKVTVVITSGKSLHWNNYGPLFVKTVTPR